MSETGFISSLKNKLLSRRQVLKGITATCATATLAGCSSGDDDDSNSYVSYRPDLSLDQAERIAFNTGPFNCGGKCVHKFHVKNERIFAMTSAGDIPQVSLSENDPYNEDEWDGCEAGKPMQFRSCVRGYSYIHRIYQPDRLKYPLLQTGDKGEISKFKRISWDEAYRLIGEKMVAAFNKAKNGTLPYVPTMDRIGFSDNAAQQLGYTYIKRCSNASNGNSEAAKTDSIGCDAFRNSKTDVINSGFVLFWGSDPTRNSNHENGNYWPYMKAKEAGIPMVTISPVCTDQANAYSQSVKATVPGIAGQVTSGGVDYSAQREVLIPGWVPIRVGTDGALLSAMMYVLYRRKLYDYNYLKTELEGGTVDNRKCFGFWKDDYVVSVGSTSGTMGASAFSAGTTFTTPSNESFEEYLVSLETDWTGGAVGSPAVNSIRTKGSAFETNINDYDAVLEYAQKVTGVRKEVIEALAVHFADNGSGKPSRMDSGQGCQRQYAGAEYVWLVICLTAMTGWIDKKGGGPGIGMGSLPDNNAFTTDNTGTKEVAGTSVNNRPNTPTAQNPNPAKFIAVNDQNLAEIMFNGRDGRTKKQFMADAKWSSGLDNIDGVQIDFYSSSKNNRLTTHSNINKTIEAFKRIDFVVVVDNVMTPTAAHANLVLPAATNWEEVGGIGGQSDIRIFRQNVLRETMYDSKRDTEINANYSYYCGQALKAAGYAIDETKFPAYKKPADLDMTESQKATLAKYGSSAMYDRATGAPVNAFSWEEYSTKGRVQLNAPADKPIIGLQHFRVPGGNGMAGTKALSTTTGYINFYSPFWGEIRGTTVDPTPGKHKLATIVRDLTYTGGWRVATAKYVPVREGYETFFSGNNPLNNFTGHVSRASGRTYKMQFLTNKSRNRAHTCQDNVAIIKDQFKQMVYINPVDAAARGIKDGDTVYVYNDRGCTKIDARVTHYIVPGTISIEHGAWYRASSDPAETVKVYYEYFDSNGTDILVTEARVPVDVGGAENILTDDLFHYDVHYINQTASCHAGPCEISLTKPE